MSSSLSTSSTPSSSTPSSPSPSSSFAPEVRLSSPQLDINVDGIVDDDDDENEIEIGGTSPPPSSQRSIYVRWVRFHKGKSDIKKFTYTKEDT